MYERESKEEKNTAHSSAQRNLEWTLQTMKGFMYNNASRCYDIQNPKAITVKCYDYKEIYNEKDPDDPHFLITEPKCIFFGWKEGKGNHGRSISFHQDHNKFQEEFNKIISFLLNKKLLFKKT